MKAKYFLVKTQANEIKIKDHTLQKLFNSIVAMRCKVMFQLAAQKKSETSAFHKYGMTGSR